MTATRMIDVALRGCPPMQTKAEIYGLLAIHESLGTDGFTVTHVASGRAVLKDVDYGTAVAFIERTKELDWIDLPAIRVQIEEAVRLTVRCRQK